MREVSLLSLATAVPRHVIEQAEVAALAPKVFPEMFERYPVMLDIFQNSGIERRRAVRPSGMVLGRARLDRPFGSVS